MKLLLTNPSYQLDLQANVWSRPSYSGIAYSDGDEIEQRVAAIIAQATDLTVLSTELRQHCTDWPSIYHLSGNRANILRPFEGLLKGVNVLEVGAGCGAITRYLGECGAKVLALEGTPRRAAITRSRTRDLANVEVVSDRFSDFNSDQQFDVITLIGVLEYANLFTEGENPALAMLDRVRSLLKPDGKLIIAIENQLGLKYFAGAPEDHIGQAMYGIEGRYRKDQPQTFGRKVLADLLEQAGFTSSNFLAPFPDYKLPVSILTEAGVNNGDFDPAAFAWQSVRRDPQLPAYCNFSPELTWPEIFKNGLGLDFANSFLIAASPCADASFDKHILAYHYSTDRVSEYCKETVFSVNDVNGITVSYRSLREKIDCHAGAQIIHATWPEKAPYTKGKPLSWEFIQIVSRDGWTIEEVGAFIKRYIALLQKIAVQHGCAVSLLSPQDRLPGNFFDVGPQNIIISKDDAPVAIDQEWTITEDIELGRLLFRSLLWMTGAITSFGKFAEGQSCSRGEFVKATLEAAGYSLSAAELSRFSQQEAVIQQHVTGRSAREFLAQWSNMALPKSNVNQAIAERDGQITGLNRAIAERDGQVTGLNQAIAERDGQVTGLNQAIAERDGQITGLNQAIAERDGQIADLNHAIAERDGKITALYNSTSWRLMQPLRVVMHQMKRVRRVAELVLPAIERGGGLKNSCKKAMYLYRHEGIAGIKRGFKIVATAGQTVPSRGSDNYDRNDYAEWIRRYDTVTDESRAKMGMRLAAFSRRPLISIVMPVYNPPISFLDEAIQSVRNQLYPNWELCIADDASTDPGVREVLDRHRKQDHRIKVVYRTANGHISCASNSALELAQGEFIALLDHDDLLAAHALYCVVDAINSCPDVGLIYSDEDKVDESNRRYDPYFKSKLNYELLLAQNMVCHLGVYRASLIKSVGGFREGFEGAQDYDLVLRFIEQLKSDQVVHIPRVLYHWRAIAGSTALAAGEKNYAAEAGRRAVTEHLQRTGLVGQVMPAPESPSLNRVRFACPSPQPMVSIIIPTRDRADLLGMCLDSLIHRTTYLNYEVIIIDNGSVEHATQELFERLPKDRFRILRDESPFNFSALNNSAARVARGELLCLMNNDIEILTPDWLEEMVSFAVRTDVGCVGARLWYPDGRLQHGGCVVGLGGVCGHSHKYLQQGHGGYFFRAVLHQSLSAVTAACLLVRRNVFEEVGGLDEQLMVAFNDVDFCLRVREAGYRNVWTPYAEMNHHESASRGFENTPAKQARFSGEVRFIQTRWGKKLFDDPAYSPNLTLDSEDFSYAWPPRTEPI